jgi:hypothetical protein
MVATVELPQRGDLPSEIHVRFRAPEGKKLSNATVNGKSASFSGKGNETVVVPTGGQRHFEVVVKTA